jgi:dynein heavy chain
VDQEVIYGDFGNVPLEHLSVLAETVFLPMLTNPKNQVGWPEVITKEVVENLHKFIANVSVTDRADAWQDAPADAPRGGRDAL